jgi:myo-inositol-1(or 4)-monophosphatase
MALRISAVGRVTVSERRSTTARTLQSDPVAPSEPTQLLSLAHRLAEEAGQLLVDGLTKAELLGTKSTFTDLVTSMDHASERHVVDGIRAARPDDAIVGEEGTDDAGTSGVRWIIDPLDGTTNYFYAVPAYAVSIAVEVDGRVVAGVVADPSRHETFSATLGGGATCNGKPIRCTDEDLLARALVGTGFSYEPERRARQGAVVARLLPAARDIRRFGAAALDLCWVACGRLDAFYERGLQPWDLAAGALIAAEAGATVGDLAGGPASGAFALASAPGVFADLRELLAGAGAADA